MHDLKTAPVSLQRNRGQGIPEGTPDIGNRTALARTARRISGQQRLRRAIQDVDDMIARLDRWGGA